MTRAALMRGRGPGAPASETDGCKRDRPTLGSLPSPMERELVHLNTAAYRSPDASDLDETTVRSQRDRLRSLWGGAPEL